MSDERCQLLEALQARLGHSFEDIGLLERALTHRSYAHERQRRDQHGVLEDLERLEFLGDGVLYLVLSEYLFRAHPGASEGELTKRRRLQVQGAQQTAWGRELQLDDPRMLLRGRSPEHEAARGEASRLEDAFEAVLGAVFLDGGFEAAKAVLLPLMHRADARSRPLEPPKSLLQEALQARGLPTPEYPIVADGGPAHDRWFEAVAMCVTTSGGEPRELGRARARSKRQAQTGAAESALLRLVEAGLVEGDPAE
jgi:ribonuclease III